MKSGISRIKCKNKKDRQGLFVIQKNIMNEFEIQVKLHINEQLYKKGQISKELYDAAKKIILKSR